MDFSIENLRGKKYNMLTIINEVEKHLEPNGKAQRMMLCQCECGNTSIKQLKDLRANKAKSCGCLIKKKKLDIVSHNKYGLLTIISETKPYISPNGFSLRKVICKCQCGNIKEIELNKLRTGKVKNCGCDNKKVLSTEDILDKEIRKILYSRYKGIKKRCYNSKDKSYHRYGGRGIILCDEWLKDFNKFYMWSIENGFSQELQIDREDNDGNYEPNNCRWVTPKENSNNKSPQ